MVFPRLSSKEEQERIAALKRLLAETKAGWNSAIADLKEAGRICKQTQEQLAEARGEIKRISGLHEKLCDKYATLVSELWHIFGEQDRRDYAEQAKEIMAELAEARKAAEWTLITPENLPKVGHCVLNAFSGYVRSVCNEDVKWAGAGLWKSNGWTYFRPIAPPAPEGSAKPCA